MQSISSSAPVGQDQGIAEMVAVSRMADSVAVAAVVMGADKTRWLQEVTWGAYARLCQEADPPVEREGQVQHIDAMPSQEQP